MSITLTVNGVEFSYPQTGDNNWGQAATAWASAVTTGMLQKAGGTFTLTADVDFGATYGLKSAYYKSRATNPASAGQIRLGNTETIKWRNAANGADLDLTVTSGNALAFNGEVIPTGAIVNADIDAAAAIAFSKMEALTVSRALVSSAGGVVTAATTTAVEIGYVNGLTSSAQTQLTARLPLAGGTMTGDLFLNADPSASTQAATKQYVDNAAAGSINNFTVRVATTAAVVLASELENGDTLDGVVLATNDLVLVKNQASTPTNGIYVVPASGTASRYTGMDTWTEAIGATVFATLGTVNAGTQWKFNTAAGGTLGVTAIPIVQFNASQVYTASGNGLELSGSQFALELDGTTLSVSGSGIKVNQIANTQIAAAAAIAVNKLAALTASRAVVSDGSGFLASATTTATEIGYCNGLTSSAQTQIDAKIAKTLTTTRGDMIYASSANVPARLAVGSSGYIIQSDGTDPVWTDPKISTTYFGTTSGYAILATFTALTLVAVTDSVGSPVTRTTNTINFAFTGRHTITLNCFMENPFSTGRSIMARLRNTTDSTTAAVSTVQFVDNGTDNQGTFIMWANITDVSKNYELQLAGSGTGVAINDRTVNSVGSNAWELIIDRPRQ